uniref:G-protein coupled receptors family 1 profile domain-containing protein n=1 Tax=Octopus bimaculoides TaxID=37653 RepID=A0A0L8HNL1_OCTBM
MFVIYIYGCQFQKSNVETFILVLAVIDLIGCIFGMPLEMVELYPAIQSTYLCKFYKFVAFICSTMSSFILLIISIERFKKICRPLSKQITPKQRNILVIFITVTSVVLVLPPVYYTEAVPFSHESKVDICGSDFRRLFLWTYALMALIVHSILLFCMTVLYSFVWETVNQHFQKNQSKKGAFKHEQINHTNIVLFSISVLYFVSFTPTLVFLVMYPYCGDSILLQIFRVILYRTWILNSSLNPIVYGFCNRIFWKSFVHIFTKSKSNFEMEEKL